ncbi:MAG TPA: DUF4185 domain-containing protein, partial [Kofleriaceae bacterium]|nr:DUF4185 domain-containing protein [Kofleriaceae bacterium]
MLRCARLVALAAIGCGSHAPATSDGASADATVDAQPRAQPVFEHAAQLCKLLSARNTSDPTANAVQFRANVLGADLGIPVATADHLYLLFGDTIGFAGIWGDGISHPDSVGYALDAPAAVAADPSVLCSRLGILTLAPASSIGPTVDARVQADFAGAAMIAPQGEALATYIHNPSGAGAQHFANLPGDFEVPSGAFEAGGAIYVFYTTVVSPSDVTMKASYLARWTAPSPDGIPAYQILYAIDERFAGAGALGGDFINVSAQVAGDYVYLFGTGAYRASPIHLARKALATLATPGGFERFDAASGTWSAARGAPIIAPAGYGETSARYFAELDRWVVMAEESLPGSNRIVARFADRPEGPWSSAYVIHDMADPQFRAASCCTPDDDCTGVQFLDCDRTGFYGSYLLPTARSDGATF